jgi:hypothetical protein
MYVKTNPHNYVIQMEVSAINGLSVVKQKAGTPGWDPTDQGAVLGPDKAILQRSKMSLANIFFQFKHANKDGKQLPSRFQKKVIDHIIMNLDIAVNACAKTSETQTVIPFYDSNLSNEKKVFLGLIKMSKLCEARTLTLNQKNLLEDQQT